MVSVICSLLFFRGFPCVGRAQQPVQYIQAISPEPFVEAKPLVCIGERPRVEPANMSPAVHLAADQTRTLKRLDVLRSGRERNGKGLRKLTDRSLPEGQFAKHPPARGVAKSMENGIEPGLS